MTGETFTHNGVQYYVGWMLEKTPGECSHTMWINEQPCGGFEWNFLDFKPDDEENYRKIYIAAIDPRAALEQKP